MLWSNFPRFNLVVLALASVAFSACVKNITPRSRGVVPTVTISAPVVTLLTTDVVRVEVVSSRDARLSLYSISPTQGFSLIDARNGAAATAQTIEFSAALLPAGAVTLLAVARTSDGGVGRAELALTVVANPNTTNTTFLLPLTRSNTFGTVELELSVDGTLTETLQVSAATAQFTTQLATGDAYSVVIKAQPTGPRQTCVLANAAGTVAATAPPAVALTCGDRHPDDIPVVFFTDLAAVPRQGGAYVTLYGDRFGATKPTVTIGGVVVQVLDSATYQDNAPMTGSDNARQLDKVVVQMNDAVPEGVQPVVLSVGMSPSAALSLTVRNVGSVRFIGGAGASDANAGTVDAPWATLGKILASAAAGDVIYLRAGTFDTAQACPEADNSYTAVLCLPASLILGEEGLAVVGYPFETVNISSTATTDPEWVAYIGAVPAPITVAGLVFQAPNADAGLQRMLGVEGATRRVIGNVFSEVAEAGTTTTPQLRVRSTASDVLVAGNRFRFNHEDANLTLGDVFYLANDRIVQRVTIQYNDFEGAESSSAVGAGVSIKGDTENQFSSIFIEANAFRSHEKAIAVESCSNPTNCNPATIPASFGSIDDVYIDNNVFFPPAVMSVGAERLYISIRAGDVFARHNTFLDDAVPHTYVMQVGSLGDGTFNFENNFALPIEQPLAVGFLTGAASHNTWVAEPSTALSVDANELRPASARVVNALTNPQLLSTNDNTIARDNGKTPLAGSRAVPLDYLGRARDATPDRGAFEFVAVP